MSNPLTHFDDQGASRMVDVSSKAVTVREAVAEGIVTMRPETLRAIQDRRLAKGDVFELARLAGIMGAKRTAELIPLCHPLPLDGVTVNLFAEEDGATVRIRAEARTTARTGVEMEALTAVSAAALTVYDMCKSIDRGMTLGPIRLLAKIGGKSGDWRAESVSS